MSRFRQILSCAVVLSALGSAAQAQDTTQPSAQTQTVAPSGTPSIDASKLGVSFDRIRMQLAEPAPEKGHGLKIQETIQVVGKAPAVQLWDPKTANLTSAAVPFGAPTQKDIMRLIVPQEFQNYPFDMNALMQWLMEHLNKKKD
jgi:hypothetical protein